MQLANLQLVGWHRMTHCFALNLQRTVPSSPVGKLLTLTSVAGAASTAAQLRKQMNRKHVQSRRKLQPRDLGPERLLVVHGKGGAGCCSGNPSWGRQA